MQGGMKREWAKPYNPNAGPGQPIGSHRGHMSALNIRNPRPGMHYAYAHRGDLYRGLTNEMRWKGFQPVARSSGVSIGADLPPEFGAPTDSLVTAGNLVLMEIPIERYRANQRDENARRAAAINGPTDRLMDKNDQFRAQQGPSGGRINPFYMSPEHGRNGYDFEGGE